MGSIVKKIALIGIAVGATFLAPGLGSFLATQLGVGATVGKAIATVALALATSAAVAVLAGAPSTRPSPINFRQAIANSWIIIGKRRQGGLMVFFHPRKAGSDYFRYFIFAAAGHRCRGAVRWYLNNEVVTVDGAGKVTSGAYANAAWLWFGRGTSDTDETPAAWRAETDGKWSNDHVGYDVAKIYAKFKMTDAVVQAQMPTVSAEIEGSDEIRDPRDGTVGYTNLATPAFYWWLALPREEGGFGAPDDEIPDDDVLAAWTNICDEDVPLAAGGTEKRYTFDSLIETGAEPSKVRQGFMTCCAGSFSFSGGQHLLRPGYWVPPSAILREEDLSGPISVNLLGDPQEIATEVSGTFIDPDVNYQPQPVPTRSIDSDSPQQIEIDLPHVTSHTRGQRVLEIMLRRAGCEKRVSWPMNIAGLELAAMQTVTCATNRYSLSNYAFVIDDWSLATSGSPGFEMGVPLALREENPEIYEWTADMERARSGVADPDLADPIPDTPPDGIIYDGQVPL